MKKRLISLISAMAVCVGVVGFLPACNKTDYDLVIAYLSGGRGETYVEELAEAFEQTTWVQDYLAANEKESLSVNIIKGGGGTIEDSVRTAINSDGAPDVLFLNYNMQNSTTEAFVRARQLVDLTDLLGEKVYNEDATLESKLVPGLLSNYNMQPYGDGKTYALPAFYSPTGLWYDASRFTDDGKGDEYTPVGSDGKYELPHTWAEFWELGDHLNTQNGNNSATGVTPTTPSLFTYPTAGYFDGFIYSAVAGMAGTEKFMQTLGYADGIWSDADVQKALEIVVKLRNYLEPNTVSQANTDGFRQNQQAVIGSATDISVKGTALFMPNGDWLPGEMAESTPAGFEWGFMPLPAKDDNTMSYVNTYIETVYLHTEGQNLDLAKQFLLFYYSDQGAKIVAEEASAIIPTQSALANAAENGIAQSTIDLYNAYDGNGAVVGAFAATGTVTGVNWNNVLYNDLNTRVFGATSGTNESLLAEWTARIEDASDQLRAAIIS